MKIFPRRISIAGIFLLVATVLLLAGGIISLINPYMMVIPYYYYLGLAAVCIVPVFLAKPWITHVAGIVSGALFAAASPLVIKFTANDSFDPVVVVSIAIIWVLFIAPIIINRPRRAVERLVCDICGIEGDVVTVGRDRFCNAVLAGFDPFSRQLVSDQARTHWSDRHVIRAIIGDLAGSDAFQNWKTWVMTILKDWGLCSKCYRGIKSFL